MFARALLVTLQQALRSIALLLFPLTFISLIAWATAGSATGNTTDPIRASLWLWLGSHLVHFHLSLATANAAGTLSVLPLGAAIFPFLAARNGFKRSAEVLENPRAARFFFSFWYTLIATLFALASRSASISPDLYYSAGFALLISLIASADFSAMRFAQFKFPYYSIVIALSLASLVVAASLLAHQKIVHDITIVDQPGWVGGALLLLLQIGYLPNLALSSLSYFLGSGFMLGQATLISPLNFKLHGIPAIPLMGALPTGKHPMLLIGAVVFFALLVINLLRIRRIYRTNKSRHLRALISSLFIAGLLTLLSYLASGELLTKSLNPVGPRWAFLAAHIAILSLVGIIFFISMPALFTWLSDRKQAKDLAEIIEE